MVYDTKQLHNNDNDNRFQYFAILSFNRSFGVSLKLLTLRVNEPVHKCPLKYL